MREWGRPQRGKPRRGPRFHTCPGQVNGPGPRFWAMGPKRLTAHDAAPSKDGFRRPAPHTRAVIGTRCFLLEVGIAHRAGMGQAPTGQAPPGTPISYLPGASEWPRAKVLGPGPKTLDGARRRPIKRWVPTSCPTYGSGRRDPIFPIRSRRCPPCGDGAGRRGCC